MLCCGKRGGSNKIAPAQLSAEEELKSKVNELQTYGVWWIAATICSFCCPFNTPFYWALALKTYYFTWPIDGPIGAMKSPALPSSHCPPLLFPNCTSRIETSCATVQPAM